MRILLLICITILFNGCTKQSVLNSEFTKELETMLSVKTVDKKCYYPRLPTYKVPPKKKVPKGMSIEDAFREQNRVNNKLRFICGKYRQVAIETNKRYQ